MPRARRRRVQQPPATGPVWEAELAPVPIALGDDPGARPALLLLVADGYILSGDIIARPDAEPAGVAAAIAKGVRAAVASTGTCPSVVVVRHIVVAEALITLLEPDGIAVGRAARLPGVDDALDGFDRMLVGRDPGDGPPTRAAMPETWAGWGLESELVGRLFVAAADYYRAAPWAHITNEDLVRARVRGGGSWSASVMGMAGELYGLALYSKHEDLLTLLDGDPAQPGATMGSLEGTVLSLSFGRADALPKRMRKEIRAARWGVAGPAAYPGLIALNTPGGGVTVREAEDLIALLNAIPDFACAHEPMLSGVLPQKYPVRWRADGVSITFDGAPDRLG